VFQSLTGRLKTGFAAVESITPMRVSIPHR